MAGQVSLPVVYDGIEVDAGYRVDPPVGDTVVMALKVVDRLPPVHAAQLPSYLPLSKRKPGCLLNFNVTRMRDGIERVVNNPWFFLRVPLKGVLN